MSLGLCILAVVLAAIPATLFVWNRRYYRLAPAPDPRTVPPAVSVLIPARNEAMNIAAAVTAVLANRNVPLEVIVLDDQSTDDTAARVTRLISSDARVRLVRGVPLAEGWKGKVHACQQLAEHARFDWLLFLDADVRLAPDGLGRLVAAQERSGAEFLSGVPRQVTRSWLEQLLLPLIHFVLLGFLPMWWMRRTRGAAFAAGCGQVYLVHRNAYQAVGGHATIRESLHDGLQLARAFRRAGRSTDLVDATGVASCRMYQNAKEVWTGLGRNATEGLGSARAIVPMSLLLLGGQVLPFVLLVAAPWLSPVEQCLAASSALLAWLPRLLAVRWFAHPMVGAMAHPLAVLVLLAIQWQALWRKVFRRPACWRGRLYGTSTRSVDVVDGVPPLIAGRHLGILLCSMLAVSSSTVCRLAAAGGGTPVAGTAGVPTVQPPRALNFLLQDQMDGTKTFEFPRGQVTILVVADQLGSEQTPGWTDPLAKQFRNRADVAGIADLSAVPSWLRTRVKRGFQEKYQYSVLLDWSGAVTRSFVATPRQANVYVIDRTGLIRHHLTGPASAQRLADLDTLIEGIIASGAPAAK